ncbi:glycosyltransferase family 2 protein [Dactylosporangium sp. CA-092794]|uniref:glycosyltransferase family 2 protein n=1 Tax=Dactylosporangium sp. CA-092794 TaxID=3239929 RepID=UPI003D8FB900
MTTTENRADRRADPRTAAPRWQPRQASRREAMAYRLLIMVSLAASVWYFGWLLQPGRVGHPVLYWVLVLAETFNLVQALGFWWTCAHNRAGPRPRVGRTANVDVDVLIPVYNEPVEVVEPVVAAAVRLKGARAHVAILDDGNNPDMQALAKRHGARYLRRWSNRGAKAGNINDALTRTSSPLVAVLDCDHVPGPRFLEATVGHFRRRDVAFVQSPQYYANADDNEVARAAWSQQALFFGSIANGKAGLDAMFCCGTNIVFRRAALERAGGFPEDTVTEDFELSVRLHADGWKSVYVPEVLAQGLGPEDMPSYVSQQLRWSRGCISAIPLVLRSRLPLRLRLQYLLSASYFLYGWTLLVYMLMPLARIAFGWQPVASASAADFLLHFAPYFLLSIVSVAVAGFGTYTFTAFALAATSFWIGVLCTVRALLRRPARFVVTPKRGDVGWQPAAVAPSLVAAGVLVAVSGWGLLHDPTPGVLNAVAFAAVHSAILLRGAAPALRVLRRRVVAAEPAAERPGVPAAPPVLADASTAPAQPLPSGRAADGIAKPRIPADGAVPRGGDGTPNASETNVSA